MNKKVQVQLVNGESLEDVDVLTTARCVKFDDGKTFQEKLNEGSLKGEKGDKGLQGEKGLDGDSIKIGTTIETAENAKIFFKIV